MTKEPGKELVETKKFELAVMDAEMSEAIADEMEGLTTTFDRIKIPAGGGLAFEVPGEDPEVPITTNEVRGVIVDKHPVNAYWKDEFTGASNPPDCSSMDGKNGLGHPGGDCQNCPMNQWGSDRKTGKGKACKNLHRVYLLQENETFPLLLTIPPTSIKNFSNYIAKRVVGKGKRSTDIITKITLKKAKSSGGIVYSQVNFQTDGTLLPEQIQGVKSYSNNIKTITRQVDIYQDEVADGPSDADESDLPI